MKVTVKIEGGKELVKKMELVSNEVRVHAVLSALQATGDLMAGDIKTHIVRRGLVDTGNLLKSIQRGMTTVHSDGGDTSVGTNVVYAAIHEFGGVITPKHAKMLSWIDKKTGQRIFARRVVIPARPYMRPAIDENKERYIKTVIEYLRMGLERIWT